MSHLASFTVAALALTTLVACNAHTTGRKFTLAKVDANRRSFVEHKTVLPERDDGYDQPIQRGEYIGLVLNGGYLRFLNDAERPEVAIFARVRLTPPEAPEESYVVEGVYLHSEQQDDVQLEGDAYFPRLDIPLLPGLKYEGQDIQVQLRIIEIDGADRARLKTLINSAASVAAAFEPEAATAISVFQTVLSFLNDQNRDDIEFQFDFGLSESEGPIVYAWQPAPDLPAIEERYDLVLQPRVATYVVIKTEHPKRLDISGNYFDIAHGALRYVFGQALKVVTLGLFDWPIWSGIFDADAEEDFYLTVVGQPFGIPREAWREPTWHTGQLTVERRGQGFLSGGYQTHALSLENGDLVATPGLFEPCDPVSARSGPKPLFDDQGYMVVSVIKPVDGIDMTKLRTLDEWKRKLEFETKQLSPAEFAERFDAIAEGLKVVAAERAKKAKDKKDEEDLRRAGLALERIEKTTTARVEAARTSEELEQAEASYQAALQGSGAPELLTNASRERMARVFTARSYSFVRLLGPGVVELGADVKEPELSILLPNAAKPLFQWQRDRKAFETIQATSGAHDGDMLYRLRVSIPPEAGIVEVRVVAVDPDGQRIGAPMTRVYVRDAAIGSLRIGASTDPAPEPLRLPAGEDLRILGTNLAWRNPATQADEPLFTRATVRVQEEGGQPRDVEVAVRAEGVEADSVLVLENPFAMAVTVLAVTPVARPDVAVDFGRWPTQTPQGDGQ